MDKRTFTIAANKFFYYAMNYGVKEMEVTTFDGTIKMYLPDFFESFPMDIRAHLAGRWDAYYKAYGSYGVLMGFYGDLDGTNRVRVLEWINEHYSQADTYGLSAAYLNREES